MKKRYIQLYTALGLLTVMFSSCLKSEDKYTDFTKNAPLVEFPIAASSGAFDNGGYKLVVSDVISTTPQSHITVVNLASPQVLGKSVDVTISVDQAALTKLNSAHTAAFIKDSLQAVKDTTDIPDHTLPEYTTYVIPPANAFSIPATKVTIPAGKRTVNFIFNVISANLAVGTNYILPLTITDAQGITISNYKTLFYVLGVKNKYDGIYHASGLFVRVGLDQRTIDEDKSVSTVSGNTVQSTVADLGAADPITLTINADNSVTVKFVGGSLTGLPPEYTQVGVNKYDPATKTFTLHYQYRSGARTTEETLVYKGPRP
jgi:hypothetical protein